MTLALLILLLVSGDGHAIVVDRDLCERTVEAVRRGDRVTLEDEAGKLFEIEMARCLTDVKVETETPVS